MVGKPTTVFGEKALFAKITEIEAQLNSGGTFSMRIPDLVNIFRYHMSGAQTRAWDNLWNRCSESVGLTLSSSAAVEVSGSEAAVGDAVSD